MHRHNVNEEETRRNKKQETRNKRQTSVKGQSGSLRMARWFVLLRVSGVYSVHKVKVPTFRAAVAELYDALEDG